VANQTLRQNADLLQEIKEFAQLSPAFEYQSSPDPEMI